MSGNWCLNDQELKKVQAELRLASRLGFIEEAGLAAAEKRRVKRNEEIRDRLEAGEIVYGLTRYSPAAYLQYELTRFRLDFVSGKAENYVYRRVTDEEKMRFYRENPDLFTRYFGDMFSYEETADVIEKRLREEEYYELVNDLLC